MNSWVGLPGMRWIWIDKFVEFQSGVMAKTVKNVSLAEEHLHDHFPGAPIMPNSLITEGVAQTGGLLVGETQQFDKRVILGKIPKAVFHFAVRPGDVLTYTVRIDSLNEAGAVVSATTHVGDRLQGELEIVFLYLIDEYVGKDLFRPRDFLRGMRGMGLFDLLDESLVAKWRRLSTEDS
ncbi:MAG: beta-hydroxyacyl-ACP dehydratase [Planctomycetales bacterium]